MPKNVVCKKCNNLVNDWCEKVIDSPDQDMQRDCQHFCEKTNADRIRAMSVEELAVLLAHETYRMAKPVFDMCGYGITEEFIFAQRLEWLKQPAEGE